MNDNKDQLTELVATLKRLNLERTGIVSRIDGISTQLRNIRSGLVPPTDEVLSNLLEQMAETLSRLEQNKIAVLALKEKFDKLQGDL